MGKAFASPRRLELLALLAQAPRTVEKLARPSEQSSANASQHLHALHAAVMVTRGRDGTRVRYALAGEEALRLWLALRGASAAGLAEAIGREELIERLRRGDVVLVDVRPEQEFAAGHLDGARSIPLEELLTRRSPEAAILHRMAARRLRREAHACLRDGGCRARGVVRAD